MAAFFLRKDKFPFVLKYFNMILFEMKRMDYVTAQKFKAQ